MDFGFNFVAFLLQVGDSSKSKQAEAPDQLQTRLTGIEHRLDTIAKRSSSALKTVNKKTESLKASLKVGLCIQEELCSLRFINV